MRPEVENVVALPRQAENVVPDVVQSAATSLPQPVPVVQRDDTSTGIAREVTASEPNGQESGAHAPNVVTEEPQQ